MNQQPNGPLQPNEGGRSGHPIPPPATPQEESGLNIQRYLQILLKRKWLILSALAVVLGAVAVWTFTRVKIYRATTTVLVEREAPQVLGSEVREVVDTSMGNYWRNKEYMETQKQVITSKSLALVVARQLHLATNETFWGPGARESWSRERKKPSAEDAVRALMRIVTAVPVRDANILTISVEHPDPELAATIANTYAKAYGEQHLEYKLSSTNGAVRWLADQLDDLKKQLEAAEMALHDFKKKNNIVSVSLEDKQTLISRKIEKVNDALTEIGLKRMALAAQRKQILEAKKANPLDVAVSPVMENVTIRTLKTTLVEENRKYVALRERYLDKHPLVLEQKAKVDAVRQDLEREIGNALAEVESKFREVKDNEVQLAGALQQAKNEALDLNKREVDYLRLKRNQENTAKLYTLVLTRMKESDLSAQLRVSNIRLLDAAVAPRLAVKPRVHLNLAIGLILGLLLGVGLAFLVDTLDSTVKSQDDVERVPALVFLGLMQRIPGAVTGKRGHRPAPNPDLDLIVHRNPKSPVAEACRAMRTNIMFASTGREMKTIVVTSPGPKEGKTTTAVSLAITMAQAGARVLVVDTDMRRPRMHRIFGVPGEEGLTSVLVGDARVADMVKQTEVPGLDVLPCGHVPPNPAELCQSEQFKDVLDELSTMYDRVVLDSPPVMVVTDAAVLATICNGVLLVARTGFTSRVGLNETARTIGDVGGHLLGCVLNDMDLNKRGYGYYRYRRYGYYRYGANRYEYGHYGEKEEEPAG